MSRLSATLALSFALFISACSSDPLDEAKARLRPVNVDEVRLDAAKIYKQIHATPGPEFVVLKPDKWPESFKKLKPLRVGAYRDGFAFALGGEGNREWGLHIYPTGMMQIRTTEPGRFEKVTDGVYYYRIEK